MVSNCYWIIPFFFLHFSFIMSSSLHRSISRVVKSLQTMEGGGFPVRRPLGSQDLDVLDPFLMLDHFGPLVSKPGHAVGAPDHPHRGFETVSYILSGIMKLIGASLC